MNILEYSVLWSMAALFAISASLNLTGPNFVKEEFENWNYPFWLRYAVGACEIAAAIAFLVPGWSGYGALVALTILTGVLFSLFKTSEWLRMMLPALMFAISIGVLLQNWNGT
ncbi:DoxX family protein [Ensifer adhaerens]|uniref:DoxX family protein n=1 Tax=Ensifer adhaerens TaxID=106592 RepID=UPI001CBE21CD|nr:DoxX family protein [Ensifer adhaerens]MBZ7924227.1 DoxX family protein [Ensifer adhaerens]UAX96519.1 DoxX family protein [Ensifer adhaerens]UAY04137.1 DoxX family protein [Ensifer adhaerens]UAY12123.1 DoxX family protein [Ensifer adhaerens]